MNWTASYSVEEPNFTETLTQTTVRTRTGLQVRYQPSRRVTANLELNYHHDENTGLLASPGARQEFTQNGFELVLDGRIRNGGPSGSEPQVRSYRSRFNLAAIRVTFTTAGLVFTF